jgi:diguanylate cyclase (GGDEF)-like protein
MASNRDGGNTNPGRVRPLPDFSFSDAHERTEMRPRPRLDALAPKANTLVLRVVAGRDMFRLVHLEGPEDVIIGRDESAHLVLSDASVSRRHARISCTDAGGLTIQDLGSTNGTAVNQQQVERTALHNGDHVEIGAVSLRVDTLNPEELHHLESVLQRLEARNRDPLTGLMTRAWITESLPAFLDQGERQGIGSACVFVDIDHFKSVNDRFGHQVGDDVLVAVSRLLIVNVREMDVCVRFGGEEMVMFLHASDEELACEVAERVRRAIETHDWSRTTPGLQVTASFGVAALRRKEPSKEWINRADRALYAAKAAGRNRTVRASDLR